MGAVSQRRKRRWGRKSGVEGMGKQGGRWVGMSGRRGVGEGVEGAGAHAA